MFPRMKQYGKNFISSDLFSSKEVVQLTIPIVIDQGFVIGMALLNTAMISSAGIAAVSAVNMVESLNIFFISVFIALSTGGDGSGRPSTREKGRIARRTLSSSNSSRCFWDSYHACDYRAYFPSSAFGRFVWRFQRGRNEKCKCLSDRFDA